MSFESVPSFLVARDQKVELAPYGPVTFDIAYGGAFYALADCRQLGLEFGRSGVRDFVDAASLLTATIDLLLEPHEAQPAVDLCRAAVERATGKTVETRL